MSRIGRGIQQQVLKGVPITETPGTVGAQTLAGYAAHSGPRPPQIIGPLPTQRQQTVQVTTAADLRRIHATKRFPLQGFEQEPCDWQNANPQPDASGSFTLSTLGPSSVGRAFGLATGVQQIGQTFSLPGKLVSLQFEAGIQGSPSDQIVAEVRTDDGNGSPSTTVVATSNPITVTTQQIYTATFAAEVDLPVPLWIVFRRTGALDNTNNYLLFKQQQGSTGEQEYNGSAWNTSLGPLVLSAVYTPFPLQTRLQRRFLGPRPPVVVLGLPTQKQQTIPVVSFAAQSRRNTERRRFPLQGWEGVTVDGPSVFSNNAEGGTDGVTVTTADKGSGDSFTVVNAGAGDSIVQYTNVAAMHGNLSYRLATRATSGLVNLIFDTGLATTHDAYHRFYFLADIAPTTGLIFDTNDHTAQGTGQLIWVPGSNKLRLRTSGGATVYTLNTTLVPGTWYRVELHLTCDPGGSTSVFWQIRLYAGDSLIPLEDSGIQLVTVGASVTHLDRVIFGNRSANTNTPSATGFIYYDDIATFGTSWLGPSIPAAYVQPLLGPRRPQVVVGVTLPTANPVMVNTATGLLTNQRRYEQRRPQYFLFPPILANPPPPPPIAVALVKTRPRPTHVAQRGLIFYPVADTTILVQTVRTRPRPTVFGIGPPLLTTSPPTYQQATVFTYTVRTRARPTRPSLPLVIGTAAAATFDAPATPFARTRPRHTLGTRLGYVVYPSTSEIQVALVRTRPRPTRHVLTAITYPQTGVGFQHVVRTRPRPTTRFLLPPATLTPYAVEVAEETIRVVLARTRPRPTAKRLAPPTTLQVFTGPKTPLVQTRPRPTVAVVAPPATLEPEAVSIAEREIRTVLVKTRPRHTLGTRLGYTVYPATGAITVALARIRPRPTIHRLTAVSYPQISEITVVLVRTRPRPTARRLTAVTYPQTSAIQITLVRTRPRPTTRRLTAVAYMQAGVGFVHLTRTRPRPTTKFVAPPATLQPYAVTVAEDTIRVSLVRTRPRHTQGTRLGYTVYPATSVIQVTLTRTRPRATTRRLTAISYPQTGVGFVHLVRTRPRPTTRFLLPPATLEPESVEIAERTIRTWLVRTRPRHTEGTRLGYTVYPQTSEIAVALARIRPRPTTRRLSAVTYPQTTAITVVLVRTRPRPTRHSLTAVSYPATSHVQVTVVRARSKPRTFFVAPPATLQPYSVTVAEDTVRVSLVKTRPRHTVGTKLNPPTVLQTFAGPVVALTKARPRPTTKFLLPPTVIRVPSVEQREDTITVALVETRPRPTTAFLVPPLVKTFPPVVTTFLPAHVVQTRPRPTRKSLRPPTVVIPLPTLRMQTVTVALTRTRPRPTRHALTAVFYRQTSVIRAALVRVRPRATTAFLNPPTTLQTFGPPVEAEVAVRTPVEDRAHRRVRSLQINPVTYSQTGEIAVTLVKTRPRPTANRLGLPTVLQTFRAVTAPLVKTRPRPTTAFIAPPATLEPYAVELREDTITVALVRTRPRLTHASLLPPTAIARFVAAPIRVALARTRPRPQAVRIAPPTILRPVETTIRVALARTRPRPTAKRLSAVYYPATSRIQVTLARTRPRPTTHRVNAPIFRAQTSTIRTVLVTTRPRPTARRLAPPTVLATTPPVETTLRVHLVATRPRPTRHFLTPFTTFRTFAPVETTLHVHVVRTRPPRTHAFFVQLHAPPTVPPRPGMTTGIDVAASGQCGITVAVTGSATSTTVSDSATDTVVASTGAASSDVVADEGDIHDQPGGLT